MKTKQDLGDIFYQLAVEGYVLPEAYESIVSGLDTEKGQPNSPWYVRLFVGISAWLSTILFIAFLFIANITQIVDGGLFWGLAFCAIAVGLNRLGPRSDFLGQLGLALSLVGQILFVTGFTSRLEEIALIALFLIILETALIWMYHDGIHRFVSTLVIVGSILVMLFDLDLFEMVHVLVFVLAIAVFLVFKYKNRLLLSHVADLVQPVGYGATVALLGMLILPLTLEFDAEHWWITAILLWGVLLFLVFRIVANLGHSLNSGAVPWLLIGCVVLVIPAIRMPGILGALLILLLGFWRSDRLLLGLAAVFLVFYLGAYYYSLEWTLLIKSLALTGTGLILLTLRYVLLRFTRGGLT
jgi:hypothetical protein